MKQYTTLYTSIIIVIFMFFPPSMSNAWGRAISGDIRLTYQNNERESNSGTSSQSSLEKKYRLNYRRFWLSPRLLTYSLSGSYTQEDGEDEGYSFESESFDYNIFFSFLELSRIPFKINAYRNTSNYSTHLNTDTPTLEQIDTGLALNGAVELRKYPTLRYFLRQRDRERTGTSSKKDDRRRDLHLSLSEKWKNASAELIYDYRNTLDRLTDSETGSHTLNLSARSDHRLSRVTRLQLSANADYVTPGENMGINTSAVLNYEPSSRFKNSTRFNFDTDLDGVSITVRNNTQANYRINRNLLSNGQVSFLSRSGSSGDSTSETANGSLNYSASLPANIRLVANTGAGYGVVQGDSGNSSHHNANIFSGLVRSFSRIRSSLSTSAEASYENSSDGDNKYRYQVRVDGSNNYIKRLKAKASGKYSVKNEGRSDDERSITGSGRLSYKIPLSWRAVMGLNVQASIERGDTKRETYGAGQNLTYLLHRNLSLSQSAYYWMEPASGVTTIDANVDIRYRLRRIFLTVEYDWQKDISITSNTLKVQVTRSF